MTYIQESMMKNTVEDCVLAVSLHVPTTDEEALQHEGMIPAIALAAGAMARSDGLFTIQEYEAFASVADALASKFSDPLLLRVLMLKGVLDQNISFKDMLRKIKDARKGHSQEELHDFLLSIIPIIKKQGHQAHYFVGEWASALGIDDLTLKKIKEHLPENIDEGLNWLSKIRNIKKTPRDQVKQLALIYQDQTLLDQIDRLPTNVTLNDASLKVLLKDALIRALDLSEQQLKSAEDFSNEELAASNFFKIATGLVDQVKNRLSAVQRRLLFEMEMFQKDLAFFVENSTNELELSMHHLVHDRNNWDDPLIWERFSEGEACKNIMHQWSLVDFRYSGQLKLWELELADFSQDLSLQIKTAFDYVDPRAFAGLVPHKNIKVSLQRVLDSAANVTLGTAAVTIAGSGIIAAYGGIGTVTIIAKSVVGVTTAIVGTAALPYLAAGTVVAVGGGAIYKLLSNRDKRKENLIQDKREIIKKKILEVIGDPLSKYQASLTMIMDSFNDAASKCCSPMVKTSRLAVIQKRLEMEAMNQILKDTRQAFNMT